MSDTDTLVHEPVVYADLTGWDIVNNEQHREAWLDLRRGGIGGSEAAAIVGVDPWSTAFELFHDKKGRVEPKEQTRQMEWGHRLEDSVRRWFADETGLPVVKRDVMYQHPDHPWMLANMDGEVGDDAILECKNTDARHEEDWADGPPLHYTLQTNHYLAVSGRRRAYIAVLIGGNDPRYFVLDRDEELIGMLIAAEERFWYEHVLADVEPPVTARLSDAELLGGLYDPQAGSEILLPPNARQLLVHRAACKTEIAELEEQILACENQVKAMLGDHEIGLDADGKVLVTWKSRDDTRIDAKRLRAELPEVAETYSTTKKVRMFLPKVKE